ncbi:hypothetical protein DFH11DRAFT_234908 [Phellopilus nigrolimitatus]|nr:hypothetical protein DFH11DRAFT_234908 [Phellopilus nigrolimitatus]
MRLYRFSAARHIGNEHEVDDMEVLNQAATAPTAYHFRISERSGTILRTFESDAIMRKKNHRVLLNILRPSNVEFLDQADAFSPRARQDMYSQMAIATILVYDTIIGFDKEVKYFWTSPCSFVSVAYFLLRYIGVIGVLVSFCLYIPMNEPILCHPLDCTFC